ncbi:hypothetical protein CDL12_22507 [Handroanthus impetiginosus]|uniref:Uncharacterized protein n=1 Tax=Handroanthus impetiginosus TaxID=429701 RepID=A0A2G9GI33_9LAMI|nr:hypothetical protein CDL12_22507 [Handroanthus impetiginosus]
MQWVMVDYEVNFKRIVVRGLRDCIFPDKLVTTRPVETRVGSGKGSPEYWVAVVKPGRILYEMGGVTEKIARRAINFDTIFKI